MERGKKDLIFLLGRGKPRERGAGGKGSPQGREEGRKERPANAVEKGEDPFRRVWEGEEGKRGAVLCIP